MMKFADRRAISLTCSKHSGSRALRRSWSDLCLPSFEIAQAIDCASSVLVMVRSTRESVQLRNFIARVTQSPGFYPTGLIMHKRVWLVHDQPGTPPLIAASPISASRSLPPRRPPQRCARAGWRASPPNHRHKRVYSCAP